MADGIDERRGARIAGARKARAMTQEVLGRAAGVSAQTVKRAEAGRPVQAETVQALCAVLGLETVEVVGSAPETTGTAHPVPPPARRDGTRWDLVGSGALWLVAALVENVSWSVQSATLVEFRTAQCVAVAFACAGMLSPLAWSMADKPGSRRSRMALATAATIVGLGAWPALRLHADLAAARTQVGELRDTLAYGARLIDANWHIRALKVHRIQNDFPHQGDDAATANAVRLRLLEEMQAINDELADVVGNAEGELLVPASLKEELHRPDAFTSDARPGRSAATCMSVLTGHRASGLDSCVSALTPTRFDRFAAFWQTFVGGDATDVDQDDLKALKARLASDEFSGARRELSGDPAHGDAAAS